MLEFTIIAIGVFIISGSFLKVNEQSVVIIERSGNFHSIRQPGFHFKIPMVDRIAGHIGLETQEQEVTWEIKENDIPILKLKVVIHYKVKEDYVQEVFYSKKEFHELMTPILFDSNLNWKDDDIALALKSELSEKMRFIGYEIIETRVTDINPNKSKPFQM